MAFWRFNPACPCCGNQCCVGNCNKVFNPCTSGFLADVTVEYHRAYSVHPPTLGFVAFSGTCITAPGDSGCCIRDGEWLFPLPSSLLDDGSLHPRPSGWSTSGVVPGGVSVGGGDCFSYGGNEAPQITQDYGSFTSGLNPYGGMQYIFHREKDFLLNKGDCYFATDAVADTGVYGGSVPCSGEHNRFNLCCQRVCVDYHPPAKIFVVSGALPCFPNPDYARDTVHFDISCDTPALGGFQSVPLPYDIGSPFGPVFFSVDSGTACWAPGGFYNSSSSWPAYNAFPSDTDCPVDARVTNCKVYGHFNPAVSAVVGGQDIPDRQYCVFDTTLRQEVCYPCHYPAYNGECAPVDVRCSDTTVSLSFQPSIGIFAAQGCDYFDDVIIPACYSNGPNGCVGAVIKGGPPQMTLTLGDAGMPCNGGRRKFWGLDAGKSIVMRYSCGDVNRNTALPHYEGRASSNESLRKLIFGFVNCASRPGDCITPDILATYQGGVSVGYVCPGTYHGGVCGTPNYTFSDLRCNTNCSCCQCSAFSNALPACRFNPCNDQIVFGSVYGGRTFMSGSLCPVVNLQQYFQESIGVNLWGPPQLYWSLTE